MNDAKITYTADYDHCVALVEAIEYKIAHVQSLRDRADKMKYDRSLKMNDRRLKLLGQALDAFRVPVDAARREALVAKSVAKQAKRAANKRVSAVEKIKETVRRQASRQKARA